MWQTLKAAFRHREQLPLLGEVPVNILAVALFAALGFGHPAFWWLGAGLEAAWLFLCLSSPRFRRAGALPQREAESKIIAAKQRAIFLRLTPPLQQQHESLRTRISQVAGLWQESGDGTPVNTGMEQLEWLHLKLLLARQHLAAAESEAPRESIQSRLKALRNQLSGIELSPTARTSLEATQAIVEERLETSVERARRLDEIDAGILRIEQQLELTREQAVIRSHPSDMPFSVALASHTLSAGSELFGSSLTAVSDVDAWYERDA